MTLPASVTQNKFLGNSKNKSQLIKFLQEELKRTNIMSQQSVADADVDIVLKTIDTASGSRNNKVVIVLKDTDVLTMLASRTPPNLEVFLLKPPSAKVPDVVYSFESLASRSACISTGLVWFTRSIRDLSSVGLGWELVHGELSPITMTQEAGPDEILRKISCSCETDCARIEFGILENPE
ncbi:unnamed protein product [Psylliodes chrysocephalus]|uniref:Uncharacterized protein n=1 Tax=Psylliodes chrysocephalus TaxID=3402493 RepID=A0A9P0GCS0_9CUCU|nr:unnamed protein product [Psylliodes chrysocephala]